MAPPGRGASEKNLHDKTSKTVHKTSDINGGRIARGAKSALALLALSLAFALPAQAGPAAGTIIPNQASATAQVGSTPFNACSNTVSLTVSAAAGGSYAATLDASRVMTGGLAGSTVVCRPLPRD